MLNGPRLRESEYVSVHGPLFVFNRVISCRDMGDIRRIYIARNGFSGFSSFFLMSRHLQIAFSNSIESGCVRQLVLKRSDIFRPPVSCVCHVNKICISNSSSSMRSILVFEDKSVKTPNLTRVHDRCKFASGFWLPLLS